MLMKRFREAPTNNGKPNDCNSPSRASAVMLCSGVLPKPMPGSSTILPGETPAFVAISSERAKTGIGEQQLLAWANFSDYMRIPGMGKAKVGLVRAAGVPTVRELALRNPARLAQNMKDVNTKRKLVRVMPSEKSVEQLIAQARKLQPKISY